MPRKTEEEIVDLIDAGQVIGFTLDTTEFHHLGYNFQSKSLLAVGQFKRTNIKAIFSEVVLNEVHAHLRDNIKGKIDAARSGLRQIAKAAALEFDVKEAMEGLGIPVDASEKSRQMLDDYVEQVEAEKISVDHGVSLRRLHDLYFASEAPFSSKNEKKNEFPDAISLLSLEHWAQEAGGFLLAVSSDGDWARFASQSDHIICVPQLARALNLFNRDYQFVAARLLMNLENGNALKLKALINTQVERALEEIDIEANAPYYYESEDEYGTVDSWSVDGGNFNVLDYDDETVTVSFLIEVTANFHATFSFSVWDSIDKDHVGIGGAQAQTSETFDLEIIATVDRDDDSPDPDISSLEAGGQVPTVDFGHVEADFGDDREDW